MKVSMEEIKKLRKESGAGVMDAKRALEETGGDMKKAKDWIAKRGLARAEKKAERETKQGLVQSYVHHDGRSGALVKLLCETDFVARTDDFKKLAYELALQVTSMEAKDADELLKQIYVRDPKITVGDLVKQTAGKLGENIRIGEIVRMGL